jgi:hypothetical protein
MVPGAFGAFLLLMPLLLVPLSLFLGVSRVFLVLSLSLLLLWKILLLYVFLLSSVLVPALSLGVLFPLHHLVACIPLLPPPLVLALVCSSRGELACRFLMFMASLS